MIYFIGAGPGDPELMTIKGQKILQRADVVLYTGSLVPSEVLQWCSPNALICDSQEMSYDEIFAFLRRYQSHTVARVHTGDPSIYSTIAKQIAFLKEENIPYSVVPGVSAAMGAAASLGIEYTIPGVSQTLILSRVEGKTPNPEKLENVLACRHSALVFYLSIQLIDTLVTQALTMGYDPLTPCYVVHKATWIDEKVYKGTLQSIASDVQGISGLALIMLGQFLHQEEAFSSTLYT